MNKKGQTGGQAVTLQNAPRLILLFVLIGMILGSGTIALVAFRDTADTTLVALNSDTFVAANATSVGFSPLPGQDACASTALYNSSNVAVTSEFTITNCEAFLFNNSINGLTITANYTRTSDLATESSKAINNSVTGGLNFSAQLPTVGTILGVGLILVVVIGVFAFFAMRQ